MSNQGSIQTPSNHVVPDDQLIAFVLGELDASTSERVARHVGDCAGCQATIASFENVRAILRQDDSVAAPPATLLRAQAIFRQHASISTTNWLGFLRSGLVQSSRRLAGAFVLVALLLTFVLLYGSAQLFASAVQDTVPGDALYPVKTSIEEVGAAVAIDQSAQVEVQLSIAQARVTETKALVARRRYDLVPKTTEDYQQHVKKATTTLGQVLQQNPQLVGLAHKAEEDLTRHQASFSALHESSPGEIRPQIQQAVIASSAAKTTVQNQLSNIANPTNTTPAPPVSPSPIVRSSPTRTPVPPAAANTVAPAPTVVNTFTSTVESPTIVLVAPSTATSVSTPTATPRSVSATPTVPPTSTSVTPTITPTISPAVTETSQRATSTPGPATAVPTSTPEPTNTLEPTSPAPTATVATQTPTAKPNASPTPSASPTATHVPPSATPSTTATWRATPTHTRSIGPSEGVQSATPTTTPSSTTVLSRPSVTMTLTATPALATAATTTATTSITVATPTPTSAYATYTPTKTPRATPTSTVVTSPTSASPTGSSTNGEPTATFGVSETSNEPISVLGISESIVVAGLSPTPKLPNVTVNVYSKSDSDTCAPALPIATDRRVASTFDLLCDVLLLDSSWLPPISFGSLAFLASQGIIIRTR